MNRLGNLLERNLPVIMIPDSGSYGWPRMSLSDEGLRISPSISTMVEKVKYQILEIK